MDVNTAMSPDEALDAARQAATDYECATSMSQESDAAERLLHAFRVLDATLVHDSLNRPAAWSGYSTPAAETTTEDPDPDARFEVLPKADSSLFVIWDNARGGHVSDSVGDAIIAGVTVFRTEEYAQRVAARLNEEAVRP
jgi:hypothetical protein